MTKSFKYSTQQQGKHAETAACNYLMKQGLSLITKNFSSRHGEIDLIMKDQNYLVFIEVRLRNHPYFGNGAESIDFQKCRKIIDTAKYYLYKNKLYDSVFCRFDIISVSQTLKGSHQCQWIKNAFENCE